MIPANSPWTSKRNNALNNQLSNSNMNLSSEEIRDVINSPLSILKINSDEDPDNSRNAVLLRETLLQGYRTGFRIIFLVMAALAGFAFIMAWLLMPELGLDRKDDAELKAEGKEAMKKLEKE